MPSRSVVTCLGAALLFLSACREVACVTEGRTFSAKSDPYVFECCEGLVQVDGYAPSDRGESGEVLCVPDAPPDVKQCLPCGNGTCDDEEDVCNCPTDCSKELTAES